MDDTDLSGMTFEDAREYIIAWLTEKKMIEQRLSQVEAELAQWRSRVALAEEKLLAGQSEIAQLLESGKAKLADLETSHSGIRTELADIEAKISAMKAKLPLIKAGALSIDPDALLADLQMATGTYLDEDAQKKAALDKELHQLESESKAVSALEELKKNMGNLDK